MQHFKAGIRTPRGILYTAAFVLLGLYFVLHWRLFGRGLNEGSPSYMVAFFAVLLLGLFTYLRYMAVERSVKTRCITLPGAICATVLFGVLWHFGVELIVNEKWRGISREHHLMSIGICAAVFLFLFFLFHSLKAAVGIGSLFYFIFALAEYYTLEFRGIPVMFYDLLDIGAAADVAGNYVFDITKNILLVFYILLLTYMNISMQADRKPGLSRRSRVVSRIAATGIAALTVWGIGSSSAFSASVGRVGTPRRDFYQAGSQLCFIQTIKNAHISAPEGYSVSALAETAAPYIETAAEYNEGLDPAGRPNIIAIMDEAFADVDIFDKLGLKEEVMPFLTSLTENTVKGRVMVSTYGGGTGRSEFEFNTGGSMHLFSLSASPYAMFGQRMKYALAAQMKAQGYHTVAIHPYSRTNYNRERTYAAMGFDEFLAKESFKGAEKVRSYVSDHAAFERMCDLIDETEEPLFSFCVTMQNHSSYTHTKFTSTVEIEDHPKASQYLSLVKITDEAIKQMITRLKESDEKTMVIFFGDHFPSLPEPFYTYANGATKDGDSFETTQLYYQTPFFIWANFEIPEAEEVITSTNYLAAEALQMAGVSLTGWQQYLLSLKEEIPAFSGQSWYGADGHYHEHGSDPQVEELLRTYDSFEYNEIIDKGHTLSSFFGLEEQP